MRITGWFIDGFGIFHDHAMRDIPSGLTVFEGPNEAGKTTLLAFIRATLFGYPDPESGGRDYAPLRGGPLGGRLFLQGPDGDYVVERHRDPGGPLLMLPDGRAGGEADLRRLLGGADRTLFETVFAFTLTELQDFATLDAAGIYDRIFSAGIVGAGTSARAARERLQASQHQLLRPRGGAPINDLVLEIEALDRRLADARREAAGYSEALRRERAAQADIDRLGAAIEQQRTRQRYLRALGELWPVWYRRREALRELAALEPVDWMPERGAERLAELAHALDLTARQAETAERELNAVSARRQALVLQNGLTDVAEEVLQLHETLPVYRDRIVRLPEVAAQRREALTTLADALRDLGPDWDTRRLAGFDSSVGRRDEIRAHAETIEAADQSLARAEAAVRRAREQQEEAIRARDALRQQVKAQEVPAPSGTGVDQETVIRRLRANLTERGAVEARIEVVEKALEQLTALEQRAVDAAGSDPSPWVKVLLWVVALALAIGSVLLRHAVLSPVLAFLAVIVALIALSIGRGLLGRGAAGSPVRETFEDQETRLTGDLEAFRRHREEINDAISGDAARLDLPFDPTLADVDAAAERVGRAREAHDQQARLSRELAAAEQQIQELEAAMTTELAASAAAAEERFAGLDQWNAWKQTADLPPELTPQGALDFFESVRAARETLRRAEQIEREFLQVAQFTRAYEERAGEMLSTAGQPGDWRGLDLVAEIQRLRERVGREREAREERAALEMEITQRQGALDAARQELAAHRRRREALLAEVGAADEAAFYRRLELYAQRQALSGTVRECDQRIAEQIGGVADDDTFAADIATGALEHWTREADAAGQVAVSLGEQRDDAIARRRDAERTREQLARSTAVPDLELERSGLLQRLAEAIHAWRTASLAEGLIAATLARFERERQPAVLAEASRLFAEITAGEYTRLLQHEGGLRVVDHLGRSRTLASLSRGTAEQLYLCIRLGLAAEWGSRAAVLPLVMDDVLVNFDPERGRTVAEILGRFAEKHQILLFTCHPALAELITDACPGAGHYVMARGGRSVQPVSVAAQ